MNETLIQTIRDLSQPLEPHETGEESVVHVMSGIKAILFDIYGTLIISGSGDVGAHAETMPADALNAALEATGLSKLDNPELGVDCLHETIRNHQERHRIDGVEFPEIDIVAVWSDVLQHACEHGWVEGEIPEDLRLRLCVEYECRVNPVWPMPGFEETIAGIRDSQLELGIISNAQFFTELIFPALCEASLDELGFRPALQVFSYRYLRAKPGEFLYRQAADALGTLDILPEETLYIGNDMLKDIWPASRVGFRTALFAGDRRSLRRRDDDDRIKEVRPDLVVTDLRQLLMALGVG